MNIILCDTNYFNLRHEGSWMIDENFPIYYYRSTVSASYIILRVHGHDTRIVIIIPTLFTEHEILSPWYIYSEPV